ncbi:homeodomain interacting protein kinase [Anaeramoeba flamelloides]|uniref:Homeodomain interacting protein kinase n=1 Tax=Anaeramoeba flamelloides TaxID=1746091 RepID=A0ABQ8ZC36_9EUKA|nr:homeodomain interacting protein kinase [Anaeramoeba flamelloides]
MSNTNRKRTTKNVRTSAFRLYECLPVKQRAQSKKLTLIRKLTTDLLVSYKKSNSGFQYDQEDNPKRTITKNKIPVSNNDLDNSEAELIIYVNQILSNKNHKYRVLEMLGSGTFGQVVKCKDLKTKKEVAIKIVKNLPAYFNQALTEIQILKFINKSETRQPVVELFSYFMFQNHLCLVFELLSVNLYELIKWNHYRGLEMKLVCCFMIQILSSLIHLYDHGIIHCDLKPENILLEGLFTIKVKLIDFGSACFLNKKMYNYIQSRYYRSPEVVLRLPYTQSIDMWSFGCLLAELFIGLPLFPGSNEYDQLARIIQLRGNIPKHLLTQSRVVKSYFNLVDNEYQLKSIEEFYKENQIRPEKNRKCFTYTNLKDLILNCQVSKVENNEQKRQSVVRKLILIDLLEGLLEIDPEIRWTPKEAIQHPFFTGETFTGKFVPKRSRVRKNYPLKNIERMDFGIDVDKELKSRYGFDSSVFQNLIDYKMKENNFNDKNSYNLSKQNEFLQEKNLQMDIEQIKNEKAERIIDELEDFYLTNNKNYIINKKKFENLNNNSYKKNDDDFTDDDEEEFTSGSSTLDDDDNDFKPKEFITIKIIGNDANANDTDDDDDDDNNEDFNNNHNVINFNNINKNRNNNQINFNNLSVSNTHFKDQKKKIKKNKYGNVQNKNQKSIKKIQKKNIEKRSQSFTTNNQKKKKKKNKSKKDSKEKTISNLENKQEFSERSLSTGNLILDMKKKKKNLKYPYHFDPNNIWNEFPQLNRKRSIEN